MEPSVPCFKVGDFVRCAYDFFDFFSYWYNEEGHPYMPLYGIVVEVADVDPELWFSTEVVYRVYCMDGTYRFFLEDEITMV